MSDLSGYSLSNGYISVPVTTDPDTLQQNALAAIAALLPGWVPNEGALEVMVLEQVMAAVAETAQVASSASQGIFSYFGSLVGIPQEQGGPASAVTTWTMVDTQGYSIPAGTVVGYALLGNSQLFFETVSAFTVLPGQSEATGITVTCQQSGSLGNGFVPQALVLYTQYSFVASVVSTSTSSGGTDPETLTAYLSRLSAELQLLTPRPILPQDFAALAPTVTGVYRATAINGLIPGRTIVDATLATSTALVDPAGSFTPTDVGRSVTGNAYVPTSTTISAYVSPTQVTMSAAATGSGTSQTVVLGNLTNQARAVTVAACDVNGNALVSTTETALASYLEAMREVNFVVSVIGPTITAIDVSWTGVVYPTANGAAVQAAADAALTAYLSPANWGGGNLVPPYWDPTSNIVRYLEVASIIGSTPGLAYISTLGIAIHGGGLGQSDIDLPGTAPLAAVGTISGSVTG